MPLKSINIPRFAHTQQTLLSAELSTETLEAESLITSHTPSSLQHAGFAVINLTIASTRTGLGGKIVLELSLDPAIAGVDADFPVHGIRTGDIVLVAGQPAGSAKKREVKELKKKGVRGVVVRVGRGSLQVACDGEDEGIEGRLWIVKLADEVTYKRMNQAMEKMKKMTESDYTPFMRVLFGLSSPSPAQKIPDSGEGSIKWVNESLNDSQKEAVRFSLGSHEISLIHGPPGTGKTHTLIELILQLISRNKRILVCGPSNISVDNIAERLAPHKVLMVRIGHPARLLPSILNHSLEVLTKTSEAAAIVRDIRAEMDSKQASIRKTRNGRERRAIYGELKELRKEYRERERKCVEILVRGSKVVLATLHGAGSYQVRGERFDVVIIDEASQALEAQCWVALVEASKAVCAGDHLQLPPTVKTKGSSRGGLEKTLFDRLLETHGNSIKRMLTTQYRMHKDIMEFPSGELYNGKLVAYEGVKDRLLNQLPGVESGDDTDVPLIFYDTQGGDFPEQVEDNSEKVKIRSLSCESKSNEMEAALVKKHVRSLVGAGVPAEEIAVISPYNAQVGLLSSLKETFPGVEVGSVDGFQGREKEVVIVSLVRSNEKGEVGFLGEKRRLNVAMTRPKRCLVVIGDSETIRQGSGFLKKWMAFLEEKADLRYPDVLELRHE